MTEPSDIVELELFWRKLYAEAQARIEELEEVEKAARLVVAQYYTTGGDLDVVEAVGIYLVTALSILDGEPAEGAAEESHG